MAPMTDLVPTRASPGVGPPDRLVSLPVETPVLGQFFLVAPLVLVGTREDAYDLAPKHGDAARVARTTCCFACTPRHATYRNAVEHREFTVGYVPPEQIAADRARGRWPAAGRLEARASRVADVPEGLVDGVLVGGCRLYLECALDRIVDGFGENSLVVGAVVAAHAYPRSASAG